MMNPIRNQLLVAALALILVAVNAVQFQIKYKIEIPKNLVVWQMAMSADKRILGLFTNQKKIILYKKKSLEYQYKLYQTIDKAVEYLTHSFCHFKIEETGKYLLITCEDKIHIYKNQGESFKTFQNITTSHYSQEIAISDDFKTLIQSEKQSNKISIFKFQDQKFVQISSFNITPRLSGLTGTTDLQCIEANYYQTKEIKSKTYRVYSFLRIFCLKNGSYTQVHTSLGSSVGLNLIDDSLIVVTYDKKILSNFVFFENLNYGVFTASFTIQNCLFFQVFYSSNGLIYLGCKQIDKFSIKTVNVEQNYQIHNMFSLNSYISKFTVSRDGQLAAVLIGSTRSQILILGISNQNCPLQPSKSKDNNP